MACQVTQALGAALQQCGVCDPRPVARDWYRADLVEADRVGRGNVVFARLDSLPITDALGRFAHVRGIYLACKARLTVAAEAAPVSAYNLRSWCQALYLQDHTGHQYWATLDGRDILDDHFFRTWKNAQFPGLHFGVQGYPFPDITDDNGYAGQVGGDPGTVDVEASIYAPLTTRGRNPLEGLIPLASLQKAGADALKFRIGQTLLGGTTTGTTFTGVVDPDGNNLGMQIWLDIVYLPALLIDAPYQLRNYVRPEMSGTLNNPENIHEYVWVRYKPEDRFGVVTPPQTNGQNLISDYYDGLSVSIASTDMLAGVPLLRAQRRMLNWWGSSDEGSLVRNNAALDLPLINIDPQDETDQQLAALMLVGYQGREPGAGAGPIVFEYQQRTPTNTRYAHRSVGCWRTAEDAQLIADAAVCNPCGVLGVNGAGNARGRVRQGQPMLVLNRAARSRSFGSQRRLRR